MLLYGVPAYAQLDEPLLKNLKPRYIGPERSNCMGGRPVLQQVREIQFFQKAVHVFRVLAEYHCGLSVAAIGEHKDIFHELAFGFLRDLSRAKLEARADLRDEMEFLYHTAHSIAAETPGFDDKFQMPLKGDPGLLNAARSAVQDAAPLSAIFVKHAIPSDFLDSLNAAIRKFERASEEYSNGRTACSAVDKALRTSLDAALAAAQRFDAIMRNTLYRLLVICYAEVEERTRIISAR